MRHLLFGCLVMLSCARDEPPAQNPLDYLRVGVDPRQEADAIITDLQRNGFEIGRRIEERDYVAFDAASSEESIVRVVTSRGVVLSVQAPDVRWPERLWVELAAEPRPDFDRDGQRDVIIALEERDRTCLGWAQIDRDGFATEVFRPKTEWGEAPCVVEIDAGARELLLEVSVPGAPSGEARVRVPIRVRGRAWVLDDSPVAAARWERAVAERRAAIEVADARGDSADVERLRHELHWLAQLRKAGSPMLEPADDGEKAR